MGRNSNKKLKQEDTKSNSSEETEDLTPETIDEPPKPLEWWRISDEDGYDRNLEVARVYNEFIKKQQAKNEASTVSKPEPDSAKEVIFRPRNDATSKNMQANEILNRKRLLNC